ncbi:MAG TPA: hypothetical protein PLK13_04300 [Xanthobacteraceae bacterium]|jgi:hypothetical protein|uniref:hypothetical protein n=1 Tax=Roseixanthobacter finlandensis TaxID=3119922 RepID=UPI002D06073F|nr:hypothetical protein [Xanthobacteraceae bacterium]
MSIKSTLLSLGVAATLLSAAGTAFADPYTAKENQMQRAVSAEESLTPTSSTAAATEQQKFERPSAFDTPGPYYAPDGVLQSGNPHWGPAQDADDN